MVKPGMKRLAEIDCIAGLSERAKEALDIPIDATVVNITNKFSEDGPIVISYSMPKTEEELAENYRRLNDAVAKVQRSIIERCRKDEEYYNSLKVKYGLA